MLRDIKFESIFGYPKDSAKVYCLLGSGFFRAPRSDNSDSLISDWMKKHPDANLILVSTINDKSQMTYCWVIDKADTLNNFLIRNGCYPGGTMLKPGSGFAQTHIKKETYNLFIEQIKSAEIYARDKKLGIWAKGDSFE